MKRHVYNEHIERLITSIRSTKRFDFDNPKLCVYGIPRGGYYPAIYVANELGVKLVLDLEMIDKENVIIVDDICDSGRTLEEFKDYFTATVFCRTGSESLVDVYGSIVEEGVWLDFPDENADKDISFHFDRVNQYLKAYYNTTPEQYKIEHIIKK